MSVNLAMKALNLFCSIRIYDMVVLSQVVLQILQL